VCCPRHSPVWVGSAYGRRPPAQPAGLAGNSRPTRRRRGRPASPCRRGRQLGPAPGCVPARRQNLSRPPPRALRSSGL
jgi:hypothetical protein